MQRALHKNYSLICKDEHNFQKKKHTLPDMFTPHLELSGNDPKGENISTIGVPNKWHFDHLFANFPTFYLCLLWQLCRCRLAEL